MLGINAQTGQPLSGIDHLRQSLRDILTTRIGTRVMRREYGSRLPELIDQPMNPRLAMELYAATAEALGQWEPRFRLTRVRLTQAEVGRVVLELEGIYLPDGQAMVLSDLALSEIAAPASQMPIPGLPIEDIVRGQFVLPAPDLLTDIARLATHDVISDDTLNAQAIALNEKIKQIARALGAT